MMPATVALDRAKVATVFPAHSAQSMTMTATTDVVSLGVAEAGLVAGIIIIGVLVLTNAP